MKKSLLAALIAVSMLCFGFISCAGNSDDGTNDSGNTVSVVETTGTVTAAQSDGSGNLVAKCESDEGTYIFTQAISPLVSPSINSRTAATGTSAGGTWKLIKEGVVLYSGYYEGDISNIDSSNITLNLTVEMAAVDGELVFVTETADFEFTVESATFTATVPEVKVVGAEELPAPVGEDPFKGKTLTVYGRDNLPSEEYIFMDNMQVKIMSTKGNRGSLAKYSYNATTKKIYIQYIGIYINNQWFTDVNQMVAAYLSQYESDEAILEYLVGSENTNNYSITHENSVVFKKYLEKYLLKTVPEQMKKVLYGNYEIDGDALDIDEKNNFIKNSYRYNDNDNYIKFVMDEYDFTYRSANIEIQGIPALDKVKKTVICDNIYLFKRTMNIETEKYDLSFKELGSLEGSYTYVNDNYIKFKCTKYPEEVSEIFSNKEFPMEVRNYYED